MSDDEAEFIRLLQEIRAGSQDAARELVDTFGEHILRVIRFNLSRKLRSKFDSCDFMQDVFASFFSAPPPPESFESPEAFVKYLTALAQHKVREVTRQRLQLQRYNIKRERSLDGSARLVAEEQAGQDPTSSAVFQAKEKWERILQSQPKNYQEMLELIRQGYSYVEIADLMGTTAKTVQRLIRNLEPRFRK